LKRFAFLVAPLKLRDNSPLQFGQTIIGYGPRAIAAGDTIEHQVRRTQRRSCRVRPSIAIATMLRPNTILAELCTLWPTAAVRAARVQSPAVEATLPAAMTPAATVWVAATGRFRSHSRGELAAHRMRG